MSLLSNAISAPNTLSRQTDRTDRQRPTFGAFFDDPILSTESQIADSRIRMTIEYLRANMHLNLSLAAIARTVNLSESRLRCLFSEVTGLPLAKYARLLRMEAARRLLATECLTVKEVMAKTGFKDPSHFNRDFKSAYGVTPAQYRNQAKDSSDRVSTDSCLHSIRQTL